MDRVRVPCMRDFCLFFLTRQNRMHRAGGKMEFIISVFFHINSVQLRIKNKKGGSGGCDIEQAHRHMTKLRTQFPWESFGEISHRRYKFYGGNENLFFERRFLWKERRIVRCTTR